MNLAYQCGDLSFFRQIWERNPFVQFAYDFFVTKNSPQGKKSIGAQKRMIGITKCLK
jgi:hypothetical protein